MKTLKCYLPGGSTREVKIRTRDSFPTENDYAQYYLDLGKMIVEENVQKVDEILMRIGKNVSDSLQKGRELFANYAGQIMRVAVERGQENIPLLSATEMMIIDQNSL